MIQPCTPHRLRAHQKKKKTFGKNNHATWKPKAMMTYPNDHAPAAFQAMHHPIGAAGAAFPIGGEPSISFHRENFIEEIALCHLDTASKLEKVQGLRDHINLPSGCRDAQFFEQEKKETNRVSCLHSSSAAS